MQLTLARGEVLGLAGLAGSGRQAVLAALYGARVRGRKLQARLAR